MGTCVDLVDGEAAGAPQDQIIHLLDRPTAPEQRNQPNVRTVQGPGILVSYLSRLLVLSRQWLWPSKGFTRTGRPRTSPDARYSSLWMTHGKIVTKLRGTKPDL